MREISMNLKSRAVKLFLAGSSYDEIAEQLDISKGSVGNIIEEFRNGKLPELPGMAEDVDELRHLVISLKKQGTTIPQLKGYLALHTKLREMGVDRDRALEWLDICQKVACGTESGKGFVNSALELERLTSQTGLTYESLMEDYRAKLAELRDIEQKIEKKCEELNALEHRYEGEKQRTERELASITGAITSAQADFNSQKKKLKSQLEEYMAQNKLSWKRVKEVQGVLDSGLANAGLTREQKEELSNRIGETGSLIAVTRQMGQERDRLKHEVDQLHSKRDTHLSTIKVIQTTEASLASSIRDALEENRKLDVELESGKVRLQQLEEDVRKKTGDLTICHLILDFLFHPERVNSEDYDRLVSMMISLRQERLGKGPRLTGEGAIIYQHELPRIYTDVKSREAGIDLIRQKFAFMLAPLIKDKLVLKSDYDAAKLGCEIVREGNKTTIRRINPQRVNVPKPTVLILPSSNHQ